GGARLGAGPDGARQAATRSPVGGTLVASRPAGRVAAGGSIPFGAADDTERSANVACCCSLAVRAAATEAQANAPGEARPMITAAHAAAIAPRIILPDLQSVSAEALLSSERPRVQRSYSSRMNFRGLSATPLTRTS